MWGISAQFRALAPGALVRLQNRTGSRGAICSGSRSDRAATAWCWTKELLPLGLNAVQGFSQLCCFWFWRQPSHLIAGSRLLTQCSTTSSFRQTLNECGWNQESSHYLHTHISSLLIRINYCLFTYCVAVADPPLPGFLCSTKWKRAGTFCRHTGANLSHG